MEIPGEPEFQLAHGWQRMVIPSASKRPVISGTQRIPTKWQRTMTSNNRRRLGLGTNPRKKKFASAPMKYISPATSALATKLKTG